MHVPILTRAAEAQVKSIGENQLECVCMYGLTPWIISPIDPHHCDLHKTHLFDQSLHMQPIRCSFSSPPPLSGLHKQCQKGHKEYITRLSETYSFGPSWMHILWRRTKMTDGKKKSSLRNFTRKTEIICWQNGMNTYKQKNLQPNFQTDWMMIQVLTVNHPTLKQKALMNILVTELIAVNYKLCSHCGPTKEDIPTLQSDVITKVRRTPLCVIHPWQPTLTDDLPW